MINVNGKDYPLWSQFVEKREEWIGGLLEDENDSMDRAVGVKSASTKIVDVQLIPNGEDSAFFEFVGEDFSCGFDVGYGGITAGEEGYLTFSGYGGHVFRVKKEAEVKG